MEPLVGYPTEPLEGFGAGLAGADLEGGADTGLGGGGAGLGAGLGAGGGADLELTVVPKRIVPPEEEEGAVPGREEGWVPEREEPTNTVPGLHHGGGRHAGHCRGDSRRMGIHKRQKNIGQ